MTKKQFIVWWEMRIIAPLHNMWLFIFRAQWQACLEQIQLCGIFWPILWQDHGHCPSWRWQQNIRARIYRKIWEALPPLGVNQLSSPVAGQWEMDIAGKNQKQAETVIFQVAIDYFSETCVKQPLNFMVSQDKGSFMTGRLNIIL